MLKEGKTVEDVYKEAKGMADLKKIQNIKQRVVEQENPAWDTLLKISAWFSLRRKRKHKQAELLMWHKKYQNVAFFTLTLMSYRRFRLLMLTLTS